MPAVEKTVRGWVKRPLLAMLYGYKRWLSPLLPRACRFHPTCSVYAMDCLRQYPLRKAAVLILRRLARCQPFHPGGHDPVPVPHK